MKIRPPSFDTRRRPAILMLVALGVIFAGAPGALPAEVDATSGPWLGPDGQPLPFTDARALLEFLTTAPVVESKVLSGGINKPVRLTLEREGLRVRAIFRTVDVSRSSNHTAIERQYPSFRDRFIYEVAAYEMSRLLGIDNVPPAALYAWEGQQGSIQLWIENASSEAQRIERGEAPADVARWHRQRLDMLVFDNLIFNFDRNHGNQLLDANGKLWFIDHTRAFKRTPSLPSRKDLLVIESNLWLQLKGLDPDQVRERLSPYLNVVEVKALLKRRQILVRHIERMIAQRGERQVLINLDPAPDQSAARTAL